MKLREDQKELAMQLAWGALIAVFVWLIFYPPNLPKPPAYAVPFIKAAIVVADVLFAGLLLWLSLRTPFQVFVRREPIGAQQMFSGVLLPLAFLPASGKSPILLVAIVAAFILNLVTAALAWLRNRQQGVTP